ncbi:MAG: hypothetical protein N2558_03970 [Patescibacteria group bacterium]|nr:hypothetical protein [Patescibacteria group bacterium]
MKESYQRLVDLGILEPNQLLLLAWKDAYPDFYRIYLIERQNQHCEYESFPIGIDRLQIFVSYNTNPLPRVGARVENEIGSPTTIADFGAITGAKNWLEDLERNNVAHPFVRFVNGFRVLQSSALYLPQNLIYIAKHFNRGGEVLLLGANSNDNCPKLNTSLIV